MTETIAMSVVWTINSIVLIYFVASNGSHLAASLLAFRALQGYVARRRSVDPHDLLSAAGAPPVTLLVPVHDEEAACVESVRALLTLEYPDFEIVVIDDGSRDGTSQRLKKAFDMAPAPRMPMADLRTARLRGTFRSRWYPNLWLIDKENGGKADALNAGLEYCQTPLFCAVHADTLVERDALIRIVRPFLEDHRTIASGGVVRIANGCRVESGEVADVRLPRSRLARFQTLEHLRAFLSGRMERHAPWATQVTSGGFGMFRRSVVVEVGGFRADLADGDVELVLRLHRYLRARNRPDRIEFVPDPVAWTEVPESIRGLARRRERWQREIAESLAIHRRMLFNPKYGRIGLRALPHLLLFEVLGPAVEVVGYGTFALTLILGWATVPYVIAFLMVTVGLGTVVSVAAVALDEITFRRYPRLQDLVALLGLAVLENVGYRQLVAFWRVRGMVRFASKEKTWGRLKPEGFE